MSPCIYPSPLYNILYPVAILRATGQQLSCPVRGERLRRIRYRLMTVFSEQLAP